MLKFSLLEIILSFFIIIVYMVISYLIVKQFIRLITFNNNVIYIEKRYFNKRSDMIVFITTILLAIAYIFFLYKDIKLDILLAQKYDFYDMIKSKFILKWSLSFIPPLALIFFILSYLPRERVSSEGIISDKFAIRWEEIKRVTKEKDVLIVSYNYKIIVFKLSFSYTIKDESGKIYRIINSYLG